MLFLPSSCYCFSSPESGIADVHSGWPGAMKNRSYPRNASKHHERWVPFGGGGGEMQKLFLLLCICIKGMEVVAYTRTSRMKISLDAWESPS